MRAFLLLIVLLLAVAVAGCGGGDADDQPTGATPGPAAADDTDGTAGDTAGPPEEPEDDDAAAGSSPEGREIFVSNCAGCHTLADAGTTGTAGPSFDDFAPSQESVETQVRNGGGGMPAFEGRLSDEEIETVSAYVAEHAGG